MQSLNKETPTAPRALRTLLDRAAMPPVPPSGTPPPLPPRPEQGTQTPQWDIEPTPAAASSSKAKVDKEKVDKETWRQRIKLLSAAVTASETHDKLQREVAQLRRTVQSERFRAHPPDMQHAILRRLEHAGGAAETAAGQLEAALQQLEDAELWRSVPRKREEASPAPGKLAQVVQLARLNRDMAALRTEVQEVKMSLQDLENAPSTQVDTPHPQRATITAEAQSGGDAMDVEEGETTPGSAAQDALTTQDEDFKLILDFDPRPVPERIAELEERLAYLASTIYQEQDDYKDRVDAYIEDKIASATGGVVSPSAGDPSAPPMSAKLQQLDANLAALQEKIKEYEEAVEAAEKRQELLDEVNKTLRQQNEYLQKQLELATQSIPQTINLHKELEDLKANVAACKETASLGRGPSREEIIDAVLPTVMERVRIANQEDLQNQKAAIEQTLRQESDGLLNTITPRVNLAAETLRQLMAYWQRSGGGG